MQSSDLIKIFENILIRNAYNYDHELIWKIKFNLDNNLRYIVYNLMTFVVRILQKVLSHY